MHFLSDCMQSNLAFSPDWQCPIQYPKDTTMYCPCDIYDTNPKSVRTTTKPKPSTTTTKTTSSSTKPTSTATATSTSTLKTTT